MIAGDALFPGRGDKQDPRSQGAKEPKSQGAERPGGVESPIKSEDLVLRRISSFALPPEYWLLAPSCGTKCPGILQVFVDAESRR